MSKHPIIDELEKAQMKNDVPEFNVGDTIKISFKIIEGSKERIQDFEGTVIARKGSGLNETVSIHRIAYKYGMEKVFLLNSPKVVKIQVLRKGKVRRAKLYYLRGRYGKKSKVSSSIQ